MQVCQLKISWNKLAPRTQPRDRGVQDFYIITTSFMTFHETVFCERMGSQNLSNRLFLSTWLCTRDCSDHLEKRQRDVQERRLNEFWRDWGSIDNSTTIGICTGLLCSHNSTQMHNNAFQCVQLHANINCVPICAHENMQRASCILSWAGTVWMEQSNGQTELIWIISSALKDSLPKI